MDLLGRAKRMIRNLGPVEPPAPQPFDVACPEGHRLQGFRNEGYQALRCPVCGEGIFVLPRSPLPDPKISTRASDAKTSARRESEDEDAGPIPLVDPPSAPLASEEEEAEIEWVDSEGRANEPDQEVEIPFEEELAARRKSRPKAEEAVEEDSEEDETASWDEPASFNHGWVRRNRPVLAVTAVLILVAATLGLSLRRERLKEYPRWVERGRTEGIAALEQGEFDKARTILDRARDAADALRGEIEGADAVRQAADEADLIADLVPKTLEEILYEAATFPDLDEWPDHFRRRYQGRSILIDSTVRLVGRSQDRRDAGAPELDYLVLARGPGRPRSATISLKGVVLFQNLDLKTGDRAVFGARLAGFRLRSDGSGWTVELEPKTAVLMTHPKALAALGFYDPDPLAAGGF